MVSNTVFHDYYAILEVSQSASLSAIKSAYKRLALAKHPDRQRNEPDAAAEFQLLSEAYEHLHDMNKRRKYDEIYESEIHLKLIKNLRVVELNAKLQNLNELKSKYHVLINH